MYAVYVLLLVLGLRRGEALGLAWADVDLAQGEVQISWQLQRIAGQLVRRPLKTAASEAPLPLPGICVRALTKRQAEQSGDECGAGAAWDDSGLVSTTRYGRPIEPRNFHRHFQRRCEKAGVPVVMVHTTRRTCASILVPLDVHPRVAMQILRHSQIAVTMNVYSEVSSAQTRDALRRLGAHLDVEDQSRPGGGPHHER